MSRANTADYISKSLELGILFEISAHKPGNVSVVTDFDHTRYEHFLISAVVATATFKNAAQRGIAISRAQIPVSRAGVGYNIGVCAQNIQNWQHGGNTLLGAVILLMPLAVSAGMSLPEKGFFDILKLRRNIKKIIESTTPEDAVNVYKAIAIAKPSGLGKAPKLDVNDPGSINRILSDKTSLFEVFKIAEKYDTICSEWVNNYPITFDVAYPSLNKQLTDSVDINTATIRTFLEVLAAYPDTFIARKTSLQTATRVSRRASEVLNLGWPQTRVGQRSLREFDRDLRRSSNLLNPGTTADIMAAALSLIVLEGYRP